MIFKDRFEKMSRKDLEEEIRVYKDFSKYTRKELENELRILLPDINLNEFSDQDLEDLLRSNYTFEEYSTEELREEARRHERFEEWSREELEEDYEQLENTEANAEKYKNIKWILIAVLCAFLGYYYGSMNTKLNYLEQRTEQLQQELNFIEYQNEQLEDRCGYFIRYCRFNNNLHYVRRPSRSRKSGYISRNYLKKQNFTSFSPGESQGHFCFIE